MLCPSLSLSVVFFIIAAPLLSSLVLATSKREEWLRARIKAKALKKKVGEAEGDFELLRELRAEESRVDKLKAEEEDLRTLRFFGQRVVQFGLLETTKIKDLKKELATGSAREDAGLTWVDFVFFFLFGYLGVYWFFTLLRDPVVDVPVTPF
eukprot:TRINITY_DN14754_c0_g1_i3.p1 TRINITY_DN14754_c0_g1~~TRINITY_DN14754_c0_g1_i3.p1  ORF type:complete len:152 (+),score=36.32 TRINITY_DN14754_c0_g1_i3:315-770(+)